MERYIKYKRFNETCSDSTIQDFYDMLISGGWDIIYYNEVRQATGQLSASPGEINIHIVALCGKRQEV